MENESFTEDFILIDPPHLCKNAIEKLVGIKINHIGIYQTAFTHKSALKKYMLTESFETLEFMGDSVLGFIITKFLFDKFKDEQEGFLTKARTKLVCGKTLADISSKLGLDKFILIDMYAFIDVVDLIGGIDLYLDQAVIDPTYKTLDDGVWGTLHYEPGAYHMNGREALRLARTRHTSSDFARSERQQKILAAIQKKARSFGFGDAGTLYDIVKTVLKKTETDISVSEAIQYYFRYQSFEINSSHVISSGNILYVPEYVSTEQCGEMIAEWEAAGGPDGVAEAGERPDCENALNAYTLLPRDDNWKLIKWYFREIFDGDGLDY